jgi:hypothetical protein
MAQSLGVLHVHLPHGVAYANETLFVAPNGTEFGGSALDSVVKEFGHLQPELAAMAEKNWRHTRQLPRPLDVETEILFNSGRKTAMGIKLRRGAGLGKQIYLPGDGLVGARAIEWVCESWNATCHDMKSAKRSHIHGKLPFTRDSLDVILGWAVGDAPQREGDLDRPP